MIGPGDREIRVLFDNDDKDVQIEFFDDDVSVFFLRISSEEADLLAKMIVKHVRQAKKEKQIRERVTA